MIPENVRSYLRDAGVGYRVLEHPLAVSGPRLAQALHRSGRMVAKCVLARCDDELVICVLPATELLDTAELARTLGARTCELASEQEMNLAFPGCEVGAAPPFGNLWNLPVVMDEALTDIDAIIVRGGNHQEAIELEFDDFVILEQPQLAAVAQPFAPYARAGAATELHPSM